jgi:hypothetical protein
MSVVPFKKPQKAAPQSDGKGFEAHTHCFVSGPRSRFCSAEIEHSHENGSIPHEHPDTGPGSYTIDSDEWFQMTGYELPVRRKKKFTKKPIGEQLPFVASTPEQQAFQIIVGDNPPDWDPKYTGGGHLAAARMILGSRMHVSSVTPGTPNSRVAPK